MSFFQTISLKRLTNFCSATFVYYNKLLWLIFIYKGSAVDSKEIMVNVEHPYVAPKLDGKPISYELPWTVKTAYMESV